jgi:hypothetical protein
MLSDMTRANFVTRLICLSVVTTLICGIVQPVWAQDEEESTTSDFKDPTIVTDDSTSAPDGVKDLGKRFEKKPINNPVYGEWWFWATAIGVAGAWIALAVYPLQKRAPGCAAGQYSLGCVGDGR